MKKLILIIGMSISSCAEIETSNTGLTQEQLLSVCDDYTLHESGLLVASCKSLETKKSLEKQKEIQLPRYCMNFVVDERLVLSDSLFESPEYKECKRIVLGKLGDATQE